MMKLCKRVVATIFIVALCAWAEGVTRMTPAKPVVNSKGAIPIDGRPKSITGKMKIPVILVDFEDVKFAKEHDLSYYENLFNKEKYDKSPFYGSVHDYFMDQSNGKLDVSFDIFGVFTVDTNQTACYCGNNIFMECATSVSSKCIDKIRSIIDERLNEVDFDSYDWNKDGFVDAVGIIPAGEGWGETTSFSSPLVKGDVSFSEVFLVNEFNSIAPSSFGVICHEFSHCLGLPDLYMRSKEGVLEEYDLMDYGDYGGNGYVPVGYSAYEKWLCGWQTPIELTKDTVITALKPQSENGDAFWIVNPNSPNEAFFIENRQQTGWDRSIPESGLMITHLNYDSTAWSAYYPSSNYQKTKIGVYYVIANGRSDAKELGVLYPYEGNDCLAAYSFPDWRWTVGSADGNNYVNGAILDIRQNGDGTLSFTFKASDNSNLKPDEFEVAVDGLWYHYNKKALTAVLIESKGSAYSGKVIIPSQISIDDEVYVVSSIPNGVFTESGVTDVVISEGISRIENEAFAGTTSLSKVVFSEGLKSIGNFAFAMSKIEKISLPSTLVTIGDAAFAGILLTSIEIPANVEKIELSAFDMENLDTVIVKNSTPIAMSTKTLSDGILYTAFGLAEELSHMLLRVPKGSLGAYQNAEVWKLFGNIEEYEPDSTEEHTTVVARRVLRYDLKMDGRFYDLRGRQLKGRPKHKGFFVER